MHLKQHTDAWPPIFAATTSSQQIMKNDQTPEEHRFVFDYGLCNFKEGPPADDEDKIDGQIIFVHGTIKYLACRFKIDKITKHNIF